MYKITDGCYGVDFQTGYTPYDIPELGNLVSKVDATTITGFYNAMQGNGLKVGRLTTGFINIVNGGLPEITDSCAIIPINNVVIVIPLCDQTKEQALILSRAQLKKPDVEGLVKKMQMAWPF